MDRLGHSTTVAADASTGARSRHMTQADTGGADQTESRYALRGGEDAKRRLDLIAGVLGPTTAPLLDQLEIKEGSRGVRRGHSGVT